jgi:hypothetical protein
MKKETILILTYTLTVVALMLSVKIAQKYAVPTQAIHECLLADCGDPPPTPDPSE